MNGWIFILVCLAILIWAAVCLVYDKRPRFLRPITAITVLCIWVAALWTLIRRFAEGLGPVTGMNDAAPWGIWIGADVFAGVALAAGGFVIAATVHIFRIDRFKPILRPTILTAFLGYILVAVALFIDIGRPLSWWHPLIMWQKHSIMFEVTWCVILYSTVLAIEISPVVLERLGLTTLLRLVKVITIPVVIAGVILSTMHQSSLGSLYLIVPGKLYPLWYSPLLPVFFLIVRGRRWHVRDHRRIVFFSQDPWAWPRGFPVGRPGQGCIHHSISLHGNKICRPHRSRSLGSDPGEKFAGRLISTGNAGRGRFARHTVVIQESKKHAERASCSLVTRHGGYRAQSVECQLDRNVGPRSTQLYSDLDGSCDVARLCHGRHRHFLSRRTLPAGFSGD